MAKDLTHIGPDGRARMVDVSGKAMTTRTAIARGRVTMNETAFGLATHGAGNRKGDPVAVAELAGIMAAKRTSELIPLCHPLPLSSVKVSIAPGDDGASFTVEAMAKTDGRTGVEMEALTAVSVACLTLYDMLKSVDKAMVITGIELAEKTGGASGNYSRPQG